MDTLWMALRVAVSLGVVLALMWVLHRRATKGGLGAAVKARGRRSAAVEVVGRQGIGGKASVVVVDVEGERLVLGVSEQSVSLLRSGPTPAPELTVVAGPVALPTAPRAVASAPEPAEPTSAGPTTVAAPSADAFRAELERQDHAATGLPADAAPVLPMRPRGPARRPARTVVPTAQQLQGSVLSADTWRQAAAALRGRRAG
ncbi:MULTISPECIES: FliO/MopB family protein [unclassified Curtobacterium]|uniref:FliO/MopB family protein n=1 Tax=unclassified Curtobacterium TaxID=257496 RepID=UPI001AE1906B|nr:MULTISPECIES: flagellar biosynthetic protein FliO [unclassified Curtobacterium]MBP1300412.1 flagellar biogenesis protein FliO [Curtobacterium sp. 1310]MCM3506060.1 flagellar biosynthetic protein FliO [Curtobacterium sp. ODYSSEY 48 V2]MDP9737023.1 flagellar biogenesis protein FliO [Curtobacterium sp. 260]